MNSLVDSEMIEALYRASQAGVQIDLIVRGNCCLRPGVPGVSDNIRVRSIIDRFLEHPRIFYFANGGEEEIYVGSADWMPRNFFRRIEVVFPVENAALKRRLRDEILEASLRDNVKARLICADGTHKRVQRADGEEPFRSQEVLLRLLQQGHDGAAGFLPSRSSTSSTLPSPINPDVEKARSSQALGDFDLVPRQAPQAGPGSEDGRAGTSADPVLQSLAAEVRSAMQPRDSAPEAAQSTLVDETHAAPLKSARRGAPRKAARSTSRPRHAE